MDKNEQDWEYNLQKSLKQLKIDYLECLMIHNSKNLKDNRGKDLLNWLKKAKTGLVKLGVSIYEKSEIEQISLKDIDVIQVPLSIYDQRMIKGGTLKDLRKNGNTCKEYIYAGISGNKFRELAEVGTQRTTEET